MFLTGLFIGLFIGMGIGALVRIFLCRAAACQYPDLEVDDELR